MPNAPQTQPTQETPSPLARALAAQSAAHLGDLERARGVDASTFASLAARARELASTLDGWGLPAEVAEPIRSHDATLAAVARLLDDPAAGAIPPSNDRIYSAVLDITELTPIVRTLGTTESGRRAIRRHLTTTDAATARADRLVLAFAAVCKRGGIAVTLPQQSGPQQPGAEQPGPEQSGTDPIATPWVGLEIDGWRTACAPAVPLSRQTLDAELRRAHDALRVAKRPGLIVLEAGPLLDWEPVRVAEDRVAISVMNDRLDAFMLDARGRALDAVGDDQAFGLVVHATLPATNAASKRLLFAECFRAVNLCETDDPRAEGFRGIVEAMGRANG